MKTTSKLQQRSNGLTRCRIAGKASTAAALLLLLQACGSSAVNTSRSPTAEPQPIDRTPTQNPQQSGVEAQQAATVGGVGSNNNPLVSGDYNTAALAYIEKANQLDPAADSDARTGLLLRAGEFALQDGNTALANDILRNLDISPYSPILKAQLRQYAGLNNAAQQELLSLPAAIPGAIQPAAISAQAEVAAGANQTLRAVSLLSNLRNELPTNEQPYNDLSLWRLLNLQKVRRSWLANPLNTPASSGWLQLAKLAQEAWQQPATYLSKLNRWQQQQPLHPANSWLWQELKTSAEQQPQGPRRIAILLPESGKNARAAATVQDGFLAAWFAAGGIGEVQLFNSGPEGGRTADAMSEINAWQADMVIGPIQKTAVQALALRMSRGRNAIESNAPVLALNSVELEETPLQFYQFGLDPADEARAAAARAIADGYKRAVVMVPAGDWGSRVAGAFSERLAELGGVVLDQAAFSEKQTDFSSQIKSLLKLDTSQARERELQRLLGESLNSDNRGRSDVDFVFLAAKPIQARQIKPQFKFQGAGQLPVYATSHVYSGTANAARDADIDNVRFAALPWTQLPLSPRPQAADQLALQWPDRFDRAAGLYALGYDAYRLVPLIQARSMAIAAPTLNNQTTALSPPSSPSLSPSSTPSKVWQIGLRSAWINGGSGELTISPARKVSRKLPFAVFRRGLPQPMPAPSADGLGRNGAGS